MAKDKEKIAQEVKPEPAAAPVVEAKVRFLEWFSMSLGRFKGLKPHHMNPVRAYFIGLNIPDPATPIAYDEGMKKFGFEKDGKA
jgi:hypothetical protein